MSTAKKIDSRLREAQRDRNASAARFSHMALQADPTTTLGMVYYAAVMALDVLRNDPTRDYEAKDRIHKQILAEVAANEAALAKAEDEARTIPATEQVLDTPVVH